LKYYSQLNDKTIPAIKGATKSASELPGTGMKGPLDAPTEKLEFGIELAESAAETMQEHSMEKTLDKSNEHGDHSKPGSKKDCPDDNDSDDSDLGFDSIFGPSGFFL